MRYRRLLLLCILLVSILTGCQTSSLPRIRINWPGTNTNTPTAKSVDEANSTLEPVRQPSAPGKPDSRQMTDQSPVFYPELTLVSVSDDTELVPSPFQTQANLPIRPIQPGENVQLVASDPNGAWLLVLHQNTLGWMPAIYLGFGSGTLNAPVVYLSPEEPCSGYLGSVTAFTQKWESNISGRIRVQGAVYLPAGQPDDGLWLLGVEGTGQEIAPQISQASLDQGGRIDFFTAQIDDLSVGDTVLFFDSGNRDVSIPFQASFYRADCSKAIVATTPQPSAEAMMAPTQAPPIRMITIQVISTSDRAATPSPNRTSSGKTTPWEACKNTYRSRLQVRDRASVSHTPPLSNRVRKMPYLDSPVIGKIAPGEKVEIIKGPSCSNGYVWWKIKSEKDGLTGWTAEGDAKNYWLVPIP